MKKLISTTNKYLLFALSLFMVGCKKESPNNVPAILSSFQLKSKDGTVFRSTINEDNTITVKVSPYLDANIVLDSATSVFYLSKGATVAPDPSIPQNFAQEGGVKYTVTAEDGVSKRDYIVSWGASDHLPEGEGFSYAEIGSAKNFVQLGYPGEYNNFNLADSKLYGDLNMYIAYCGESIILLSRAYLDADPNSPYGIKVIDKNTYSSTGNLNMGSFAVADLKVVTSDYVGHAVGLITRGNNTEVIYWNTPSEAPTSTGTIDINLASEGVFQ